MRDGVCDVVVAGGTESCVTDVAISGFARARALSRSFPGCPEKASRPFQVGRDGFVLSEGAGVLILESWDHAMARGAPILAELSGVGLAGESYHVTSPDPQGGGPFRSMNMALRQAGLHSHQVDYVNAHATSTPLGDAAEIRAIERLMADREGTQLTPFLAQYFRSFCWYCYCSVVDALFGF